MKKLYIFLLSITANIAVSQAIYFEYDAAGNRIKRSTTQPSPRTDCYTMASPVNGTFLTNYNGVPKLQPANTANPNSQIWKIELVGLYNKIVAQGGTTSAGIGYALGAENGDNSADTPVKLMSFGAGGDHLLWGTVTADVGEVFIRKNSTLNFGVTQGWGTGVGTTGPNASISDINLGYDPSYIYGGTKWVLVSKTCPTSPARIGISEQSDVVDDGMYLVISPNPNPGEFVVTFHLEKNKDANLIVLDAQGTPLYKRKIIGKGQHVENIYLNNVKTGIYLVQLVKDSGIEVKKAVVSP